MKKLKTLKGTSSLLFTALMLVLTVLSCQKDELVYNTSSNTNITSFLDKYPEKFSEFRKILSRTETADFLQAYGKYTLFLPNNDAVKAYLKETGKSSVEDLDVATLKDLVKFHVIDDTISTRDFADGKIGTRTMYGQYLTTGGVVVGGQAKIIINRQGLIAASNIRVGNGIIHEVDHMLTPAKQTVAQMIEANPVYSIFSQALKETGLYDTLNILPANNADKWYTVLAQTDSVFKAAGFNNYAALKARFSKTGNPKSIEDSLHVFVNYHILPGVKYLADIGSGTSHTTLAPSEIIQSKIVNRQVLINDILFDGTYEPGILLDRARSDNSASNGVVHMTAPYASQAGTTTGYYAVTVRKPIPVYWDVADFPEVRALPSIFRKPSVRKYFPRLSDQVASIDGWWWPNRETATGEKYGISYCTPGGVAPIGGGAVPTQNKNVVFGDYLQMPLGVATVANPGSATNAWLHMKTPVIVKGRYKVWICYERREQTGKWPTGRRTQCQVKIDDAIMAKPFDFAEPPPVGTHAELESQGWKYYTNDPTRATLSNPTANVLISKLVGIVDIKSTNTHTLRLDVIQGNSNTDVLDMIHFIPVDAPSQVLPRFKPDGSQDFTPITP